MASIRERIGTDGKKSYQVQVRIRGFPHQRKTFDKLAAAKQWAALTETELRTGRYLPRFEAERHTVQQMIGRYREEVLVPHKPKQVRTEQLHLDWWEERLGRYSLADLTATHITKCVTELRTEIIGKEKLPPESDSGKTRTVERTRKPSTVVRYMAALSHVLNTAVKEWNWLEKSPMASVRKPKVDNGRARFLSNEECDRLLDAARKSSYERLHAIVLLALATGMRFSEIMSLRWRDIVFQGPDGMSLVLLEKTKNGERRGIPLAGEALMELQRLHQAASVVATDATVASQLLFPSRRKPLQPMHIRKAWLECLSEAKIKDFRFHDLRHTSASFLAMSGASLRDIAEILGHKDLQMVNRYSHLTKAHLAGVLQRMNARFCTPPASQP